MNIFWQMCTSYKMVGRSSACQFLRHQFQKRLKHQVSLPPNHANFAMLNHLLRCLAIHKSTSLRRLPGGVAGLQLKT